jgi:hypothetical protein
MAFNKLYNLIFLDFMSSAKDNLRKCELALQHLMRQMKFDELQKSQVYRNLEMELQKIQQSQELQEEHPDQNRLGTNGLMLRTAQS